MIKKAENIERRMDEIWERETERERKKAAALAVVCDKLEEKKFLNKTPCLVEKFVILVERLIIHSCSCLVIMKKM